MPNVVLITEDVWNKTHRSPFICDGESPGPLPTWIGVDEVYTALNSVVDDGKPTIYYIVRRPR